MPHMAIMAATDAAEDDAALVRRAQADRAAFGAIYDRTVERVYAYAYHHLGDHHAAQDVTAEAYRRALESLPRYEERGRPILAWLLGIAARVCQERWRTRPAASLEAQPGALDDLRDAAPPVVETLIQREENTALWELVGTLAPEHARILILRYAQGQEYAALAPLLGKSPAAVKQLAYRALKALRAAAVASGMWEERRRTDGDA